MTSYGRDTSPLVSALVTTFNHERYIAAAIESLLAQTYERIEIIVADDGSFDNTVALVKSYADRGVRLLRVARGGPSEAMNQAMSAAAGDIFLLQSGDDLSSPNRAKRQVALLRDADLSASWPRLINQRGERIPDKLFLGFFRMEAVASQQNLFRSLYRDGNFLCASSVAMRRSVWDAIGGFNRGLLQLQDYDYWLRALAQGFSFAISTERLASYRLHDDNLSDVRNDVRTQRELATLLRELGSRLPDNLLVSEIYDGSLQGWPWSDAERRLLRAIFFLTHPAEPIRQIGVDALIALTDSHDDAAVCAAFGISRQRIFQVLLQN